MIEQTCLCCQERFTPNKYHPQGQKYCARSQACKRASHNAANQKYRAAQKRDDPLRESLRKQKSRRREKFRLHLELSHWRKQLVYLQMLILGIIGLLGGSTDDDGLAKTISHCLDTGREFFPKGLTSLEDLEKILRPGFGFF